LRESASLLFRCQPPFAAKLRPRRRIQREHRALRVGEDCEAAGTWNVLRADHRVRANLLRRVGAGVTVVHLKYGIQYDGTCAGTWLGIGIIPTPGFPWLWNSVYSMGEPGAACFAVHPKSDV